MTKPNHILYSNCKEIGFREVGETVCCFDDKKFENSVFTPPFCASLAEFAGKFATEADVSVKFRPSQFRFAGVISEKWFYTTAINVCLRHITRNEERKKFCRGYNGIQEIHNNHVLWHTSHKCVCVNTSTDFWHRWAKVYNRPINVAIAASCNRLGDSCNNIFADCFCAITLAVIIDIANINIQGGSK